MRTQMRRFSEAEVLPHAHEWHLKNKYIPAEVLTKISEIGVFALTMPESWDGMGLGKEAMCVVSEELSRGYIGVGSLGTRSEIACELILAGGTDAQKEKYLPKIAFGRTAADGSLHRAEHRLRPRLAEDARGEARATSTRSRARRPGSLIPSVPT